MTRPTSPPSKSREPSLLQLNKKNVVEIRCKDCDFQMEDYSVKNCPNCSGPLEWLCKCGARRSYSNLSVHSCEKTSKRQILKQKFAAKKKLVKERIEKEIIFPTTEITLLSPKKKKEIDDHESSGSSDKENSPVASSKLDVMKIENLLSTN